MTSKQKDKFICEKLGVVWHEEAGRYTNTLTCTCGVKTYYKADFEHHLKLNPDFESEAGRVQLLKLVDDNHDYNLRMRGHWSFVIIDWMYDDTGLFRDEVFRWMGGVE